MSRTLLLPYMAAGCTVIKCKNKDAPDILRHSLETGALRLSSHFSTEQLGYHGLRRLCLTSVFPWPPALQGHQPSTSLPLCLVMVPPVPRPGVLWFPEDPPSLSLAHPEAEPSSIAPA